VQSPPKNTKTTDDKLKGTVAGCTVTDTNKPCAAKEKEGVVVQLQVFVMDATGKVPDVVKLDQTAALAKLKDAGLTLGSVTKKPSATAAAGTVIEVKPAVGTQANLGSAIDVVVSGGPPVVVPSLTNLTVGVAKAQVASVGLTPVVTVGCSDFDKVSNQIPNIGSQISKGDNVSIGCSKCSLTFCFDVRAAILPDISVIKTN
jgi:serine/threonine-protein kinase